MLHFDFERAKCKTRARRNSSPNAAAPPSPISASLKPAASTPSERDASAMFNNSYLNASVAPVYPQGLAFRIGPRTTGC